MSVSRGERSLKTEIGLAILASFSMGFGVLFLLLHFGKFFYFDFLPIYVFFNFLGVFFKQSL